MLILIFQNIFSNCWCNGNNENENLDLLYETIENLIDSNTILQLIFQKLVNATFDCALLYKQYPNLSLIQTSGNFNYNEITYTHLIGVPIHINRKMNYTLNLILKKITLK